MRWHSWVEGHGAYLIIIRPMSSCSEQVRAHLSLFYNDPLFDIPPSPPLITNG